MEAAFTFMKNILLQLYYRDAKENTWIKLCKSLMTPIPLNLISCVPPAHHPHSHCFPGIVWSWQDHWTNNIGF